MTNAEARFSNSLRPRKPEGSLGRTLTQLLNYERHTLSAVHNIYVGERELGVREAGWKHE